MLYFRMEAGAGEPQYQCLAAILDVLIPMFENMERERAEFSDGGRPVQHMFLLRSDGLSKQKYLHVRAMDFVKLHCDGLVFNVRHHRDKGTTTARVRSACGKHHFVKIAVCCFVPSLHLLNGSNCR